MTKQYYKAVRHDYGSFHDPSFKYGPVGTEIHHPNPQRKVSGAANYLSVSVVPTDCTGFRWRVDGKESRLLVIEAIGRAWTPEPDELPNKRAVAGLRVVAELPISAAFGPQGEQLEEMWQRLLTITPEQARAARAAWDARDAWAAWAARAAWDDASLALLMRHRIGGDPNLTQEGYDLLTGPWRKAVGRIHPDDPSLREDGQ